VTSCSVRTGPDQLPVSVEIGFCIAVEFDTEVIELLAVVDGLLNHHATVCLGRVDAKSKVNRRGKMK